MGKTKYGDREINKTQQLINENKRLRREVVQLRKQLSRLDTGDPKDAGEVVEKPSRDRQRDVDAELEAAKKEWGCRECREGVMEIVVYPKLDDTFYYRQCNVCGHRTKGGQKYTKDVRGIVKST